MDMSLIIGGRLLPNPNTFLRKYDANETDVVTLGGTLYTDFINNRREWIVTWDLITAEQFEIIHALYLEQYEFKTYHTMQFDAYNIYTTVKIDLADHKPKYNGTLYESVKLTIREQYAIS